MAMSCQALDAIRGDKPNVISVNGVVIARDAIAQEAQNHPAGKPIAAWQAGARALVVRELLLQEARRVGIDAVPLNDEAGRRETEEEALVRGLIEREVKTPQPDEETCRRYYERNRHLFRSATIYEAAHILFAARKDDAEAYARAREEAAAAIALLTEHPERFDQLARAQSDCPSAAHGGNLGQITAGQTTPDFERALVALEPGGLTAEPVATRYGFHVIRLVDRIEGRDLPFELVAQRIADYLSESVERRAVAQYIARLVSRASITGIALDGADIHRVN
jgi:peptidyl-prolyl cis-trans isomerase C